MAATRDDFSHDTIDVLAKRAAYRCSRPGCRRLTLQPSAASPEKFIYTGVAAHITAAAPGGPRYDTSLTREERASVTNGIHLCETCAAMVDKNQGIDFPVEMLRSWITEHEHYIMSLHQNDIETREAAYHDEFTRTISRDILRLRRESEIALDFLADYARIEAGGTVMHVNRTCAEELEGVARDGALLVVGEPGAGKSGALHDAVWELAATGLSVIVLCADKLAAQSLGNLRDEIGLANPLADILKHWPGEEAGVLVLDALDAAKSRDAAGTFRDLIRQVHRLGGRWHVVASIRKFDLRYSTELQSLFPGAGAPTFLDPEFARVRHLNVPVLSDGELASFADQFPLLDTLIQDAGVELKALLRLPFNLRLAASILASGTDTNALSAVRTQIELLERYWQERVVREDDLGDAREGILRTAVAEMVRNRSLQADRRTVAGDTTASQALNQVLGAQVLLEWQRPNRVTPDREVLTFGHHILFDYAAARLLLRGTPDGFVRQLTDHPEYLISIRPSIVLHLQHEWGMDADRKGFWGLAFRLLADPQMLEIGKIIAPGVAADLGRTMEDFGPLFDALDDASSQSSALQAIAHVRGALMSGGKPLTGEGIPPCCAFAERITRKPDPQIAFTIMPLLTAILQDPDSLTANERDAAGEAARRIFEAGWRAT